MDQSPSHKLPIAPIVDAVLWSICMAADVWLGISARLSGGWAGTLFVCGILALIREAVQLALLRRSRRMLRPLMIAYGWLFSAGLMLGFVVLVYGCGVLGIGIPLLLRLAFVKMSSTTAERDARPVSDAVYREVADCSKVSPCPELMTLDNLTVEVYALDGKLRTIVATQRVFSLSEELKKFIFAHELAHFRLGHFPRLEWLQSGMLAMTAVLPCIALIMVDAQFIGPGHLIALRQMFPCLLAMAIANALTVWLESRVLTAMESAADLQAVTWTQNPRAAVDAIKWLSANPSRSPHIVGGQANVGARIKRLHSRFGATAAQ